MIYKGYEINKDSQLLYLVNQKNVSVYWQAGTLEQAKEMVDYAVLNKTSLMNAFNTIVLNMR